MACKVLLLEGFDLGNEDADLLCTFLERPGCLLEEFCMHQSELDYDVLEKLGIALQTCDRLISISFAKNNLGIDDFEETESEVASNDSRTTSQRLRNRKMCNDSDNCMTKLVCDMTA